jgi:YCII-related domain
MSVQWICRSSDNRTGETRDRSPHAVRTADLQPDDDVADQAQRPIDPGIAAVLARRDVTGWIRPHAPGSPTTVSHQEDRTLLTDGPFVDSKEFLGGLVLVEADNLDGALTVAAELAGLRPGRVVAIEVRPVRGEEISGA